MTFNPNSNSNSNSSSNSNSKSNSNSDSNPKPDSSAQRQKLSDYIVDAHGERAAKAFRALVQFSGMEFVRKDLSRAFSYMDADCEVVRQMSSACDWGESQSRSFFRNAKKILGLDQDWEYEDLVRTNKITEEQIKEVEGHVDALAGAVMNLHEEDFELGELEEKQVLQDYYELLKMDEKMPFVFDVVAKRLQQKFDFRCAAEHCQSIKANFHGGNAKYPVLCTIHCAIAHPFETGHRLTFSELRNLETGVELRHQGGSAGRQKGSNKPEDPEEHPEEHPKDNPEEHPEEDPELRALEHHNKKVLQMMRAKEKGFRALCGEGRFVSRFSRREGDAEQERKDDGDQGGNHNHNRNGNANANANVNANAVYSFGYKFYYWQSFSTNTDPDPQNGGANSYSYWFVAQKYADLEDEMLNNKTKTVDKMEWNGTRKKAELCAQVERRICPYRSGVSYGIGDGTAMGVEHFMALFFYTDFTDLCTKFSRTFRKVRWDETIQSVKERNEEFREFSRLLAETVHCFGTRLQDSPHRAFYHGVSGNLRIRSSYAAFYAPTSTSSSKLTAIKFAAGNGMLLTIHNTASSYLKYADTKLSAYPHESEKIFFNGGFKTGFSSKDHVALVISLREVRGTIEDAARPYSSAFAALQNIICGTTKQYVNLFRQNYSSSLQRMIAAAAGDDQSRRSVPEVVMDMFSGFVAGVAKVQIMVPYFNMPDVYKKYRLVFCELYQPTERRQEWAIPGKNRYNNPGYINMIKCVKFDVVLGLFPRLRNLEIIQMPITRYVMDQLLRVVQTYGRQLQQAGGNAKNKNLERIFIGEGYVLPSEHEPGMIQTCGTLCYPATQSDFRTYRRCCDLYRQAFLSHSWLISPVEGRATNGNNIKLEYFSGMVIKYGGSTIVENDVWNQFHVFQ